jgi:Holliday junction DNA helicase RuvA
MIANLSGKLLRKLPNQVVLDVHGVGYEVNIPISTFYELGELGTGIELLIHTHVREDAIALFGFKTPMEKQVFERLISISGVGPKLGITILSGMPVEDLVSSIRQSNVSRLTSIPGIGKKTAERLVVELRDKLLQLSLSAEQSPPTPHTSQQQDDAISALLNLGYSKPSAENAVHVVVSASKAALSFEELLRKALQQLSK